MEREDFHVCLGNWLWVSLEVCALFALKPFLLCHRELDGKLFVLIIRAHDTRLDAVEMHWKCKAHSCKAKLERSMSVRRPFVCFEIDGRTDERRSVEGNNELK